MRHFTIMIKPASSLCDMQCRYCFYSDVASLRQAPSTGIMSREIASSLIENVFCELKPKDQLTFVFQGGEPTLAGLDFFRYFTEKVDATKKTISVHYAIQTNGLTINDEWCILFKKYNFLIGLSLDGNVTMHNQNRKDGQGEGTYARVMDSKKQLDKYNIDYNILSVLTVENARKANRLWRFILNEKIRYIQFIPCLEPLKDDGHTTGALISKRFYHFYADLFPLWKKEMEKGNLISIQLFDDLAALLLYGQRVTCGISGGCTPQIIVESDGSVYPCDFYVLDEYRLGNLAHQSLLKIFELAINSDFLKKSRQMPVWCQNCTHYNWCQGGCKRMAKAVYGENCGMRLFLDTYLKDLLTVFIQRKRTL